MAQLSERQCYCGCGQFTNIASGNNLAIPIRKGQAHAWVKDHQRTFNNWTPVVGTTCWAWTASLNSGGYGGHRTVYQRYRGPIPDGLELDHLCRNRWCVNPDHLEPVTRSVNGIRAGGEIEHGTRRMYERHCRCDLCRATHNKRMRDQRARRRAG